MDQTRRLASAGLGRGWFRFRWWLSALLFVLIGGSLSYMLLGWSSSDAVYMTVITLTTVGFREVRQLDGLGRLLTMALALSGVALLFGGLGLAAEAVALETASGRRSAKRSADELARLGDHVLVAGYGRVGSTVAAELSANGVRVVVLDHSEEVTSGARADGFLAIVGDATSDAVLQGAGLERARGLVAALDSDANNLYVVLSARALAPQILLVARATSLEAEQKLRQAGADRVVSPYVMAGHRMAALVTRPALVEFIDAVMRGGQTAYTMEELAVEVGSALEGRTVTELAEQGVSVLAISKAGTSHRPEAVYRLSIGEQVILAGEREALRRLRA